VLKKALVAALVVIASGALVSTVSHGDVSALAVETTPVDVARIRCPAPNEVRVLDPYVIQREPLRRIPEHGSAVFRVTTGYTASMLYARRPNHNGDNFARDLHDGIDDPPGTYRVRLPIDRGRWLIGCFQLPFNTRDHPDSDFGLVHVVRP
jgi:hypothetical protein